MGVKEVEKLKTMMQVLRETLVESYDVTSAVLGYLDEIDNLLAKIKLSDGIDYKKLFKLACEELGYKLDKCPPNKKWFKCDERCKCRFPKIANKIASKCWQKYLKEKLEKEGVGDV